MVSALASGLRCPAFIMIGTIYGLNGRTEPTAYVQQPYAATASFGPCSCPSDTPNGCARKQRSSKRDPLD